MSETRRSFFGKMIGFLGVAAFMPKTLFASTKPIEKAEIDFLWPFGKEGVKLVPNPIMDIGYDKWEGQRVDIYCSIFKHFINNHEDKGPYICTEVSVGPLPKKYQNSSGNALLAYVGGLFTLENGDTRYFCFSTHQETLIVKLMEHVNHTIKSINRCIS